MQVFKNLVATTALVAVYTTSALAQDMNADATARATGGFFQQDAATMLRANDVLGAPVYAPDPDHDAADRRNTADWNDDAWDDVGTVADALISQQGDVVVLVVDVGGFLGIGAKAVAIPMDRLSIRPVEDGGGESAFPTGDAPFRITVDLTREQLEDAPAFGQETAADEAQQIAESVTAAVEERIARLADHTRDGYVAVPPDTLSAEALENAAVYDLDEESIGAVNDLIVSDDGSIEHAVVDVGGWLGWGSHTVAVPFDEVRVLRGEEDDLRVYVDYTRGELEEMPTYDG